jgi:hypothetical protein
VSNPSIGRHGQGQCEGANDSKRKTVFRLADAFVRIAELDVDIVEEEVADNDADGRANACYILALLL